MPLIGLVVSLGVLVSTVLSVRYHQLHADQFLPLEVETPVAIEVPTSTAALTSPAPDEPEQEATDSPTATPSDSEGTPTAALTITPTQAPTATPSAIPTATPSATPTSTPVSPTEVADTTNEQLEGWFEQYASEYGVDVNLLRGIAECESGFNTTSYNQKYDYAGMFQFSSGAWTSARSRMGLDTNADLRFNAEESIKTAAWKIAHDGAGAWPSCNE